MSSRHPRYDGVADEYEAMFGDDVGDPATSALLGLLGAVKGKRFLDAPCGQGRVTRELARRGATVIGVDLSSVLLDKARAFEAAEPLGVEYRQADITTSFPSVGDLFDGIVCNYGFSDIDDLDGALRTFRAAVRVGGVFGFSLLHPCFPGWSGVSGSWPPEGYYEERWWQPDSAEPDLRREVGSNHRMLSTYLNVLFTHGFVLEELEERALEPWPVPDVEPVPMFLAGRCRRR